MLNKQEFISEIIETVRDTVSVSEVIGREMSLKKSGISHKGLCPFHNDKTIGSFVITDAKKVFKCFSCGTGGDVIKYYSLRHEINYVESALKIALDYGIINNTQYDELTSRKLSEKESFKFEKIYIEKDKEKFKSNKADDETLDKVFSLFIKGFNYLGKNILTNEHKAHLLNDRHLTEEEIKERGYFTFPNRYVTKHFLNDLEENDIPIETLETIPGFFYDKKKDSWSFSTIKGGGIAIPIINANGQIHGIQIRKDVVKEGEQRYTWFSSAFAQYDTKGLYDFGVSSGSPVDVVIPDEIKTQTIFVTEGHFKAKKIAKDYKSIALSLQGVSTWGAIPKAVEEVKKAYPHIDFKYVYIAYDGDMSCNTDVFKHAINMGLTLYGLNYHSKKEELLEKLNDKEFNQKYIIYYCMWDDALGKGIDDIIFNGNGHKIDKMTLVDLYPLYKEYLNKLKEVYVDTGKFEDIQDIDKKERKDLFESLILCKLPKYKTI